jgi:Fe-S-cluster containining protein
MESPGLKRIPLYPEEVNNLIEVAKARKIDFKVLEDLVFPDILNEKILVLTYRILLNNQDSRCPFYNQNIGCTVHDVKPLACQAYPLSLKQIDAFNFQITIDTLCKWINSNYNSLDKVNLEDLKKIFNEEYPKAERFFKKNKKLILKIRELEAENKIKITRQITLEDFNKALREWNREEIIV